MNSSYTYLGNYPNYCENGWSNNIQGVTHDRENWFFTQASTLWKFPVTHDLTEYVTQSDHPRGIFKRRIPLELVTLGYNHFGDLDYYQGHLFVPMEGAIPSIVAVFRASDLRFIGYSPLVHYKFHTKTPRNQEAAPWCVINPVDGTLVTSEGCLSRSAPLLIYTIDHISIAKANVVAAFKPNAWKGLLNGSSRMVIDAMQGGAFSPDGALLYLIHGHFRNCNESKCGIKVFDWQHSTLIAQSANGEPPFNYEFHRNEYQKAEGITIWNLDNGRAPGINGQVHALMLESDWDATFDDGLFFKHYRFDEDALLRGDESMQIYQTQRPIQ